MAKVREKYWVLRLRRLVKKMRGTCSDCERFRAKPYPAPPPASLPSTGTQGSTPFQFVGVDCDGPIRYKSTPKIESKAYLVLYACSLTRAVHLDFLKSLEVRESIPSLKRFIARGGRSEIIYSVGATFKASAKWLQKVQKDEQFHKFLADFNFSSI